MKKVDYSRFFPRYIPHPSVVIEQGAALLQLNNNEMRTKFLTGWFPKGEINE